MKTRQGFVSNSSSSSFVIPKEFVNRLQLAQIMDHTDVENQMRQPGSHNKDMILNGGAWDIRVNKKEIRGYTLMDNFDMGSFLKKIGIDMSKVNWSSGYDDDL